MTGAAIETRLPCPVCLGVTMKKTTLSGRGQVLVLDHCPRCGGIWFELGEVQHLRAHPPQALWKLVQQNHEPYRGPCHNCQAIIDRNADKCGACGTKNRINCPSCDRELKVETHEGYRLDVCRNCKGVWFDHVELSAIWKLSLQATRDSRRRYGAVDAAADGSSLVLDSLIWAPDLVFHGAHAAGMAVQGGAELLTHAPEAVGALAEGAGEVAGGVFEAIVSIVGGMFDGV
jgi:Zn-finger nucleic acid-binding protein